MYFLEDILPEEELFLYLEVLKKPKDNIHKCNHIYLI